jgi:CheY-like chemotaxis protein
MSSKNPIIIVDDDLDDQFLLRKICENLSVSQELLFFDDGREVLKYLRTTPDKPFVIISDINMPVMTGFELRREINKDESLREKSIPFIFFSTAASPSQIREAYNLTVQGFFLKETSISKIESTMKMILEYWGKCKHPG